MKIYNNNESHVKSEEFIWIAEYIDKSYMSEYEFENHGFGVRRHSFDEIDKSKTKYVGLIGHGVNFNFDTFIGDFNVFNSSIKAIYHDNENDIDYNITNLSNGFDDLVLFKTMGEEIIKATGHIRRFILEYGIGYKKNNINDTINAINILYVPTLETADKEYITFRLTSNKIIKGELRLYMNDNLCVVIKADLNKNVANTFKINIR